MTITSTSHSIQILRRASRDISWCNRTSSDQSDTRIAHAYFGKKHANADTACNFDACWDDFDQPLTHADQREEDEDEAFDKDCGECEAIADGSGAMEANDLICEVGVQTHPGTGTVFSEIRGIV